MKIIELDLTGCKYMAEIHEKIRVAFGFSRDYGCNWDAFWDLLHTECDAEKLKIRGVHTLPEKLLPHFKILCEILKRNQEEAAQYGWQFEYELID